MRVSNVWVNKYNSGKLIGFADVAFTLDDSAPKAVHMVWKGFKLFQGDNGRVEIALPSRRDDQGKKDEQTGKDVYYPVITINRAKEGEPKGKADAFFEYLRAEIEKEYQNKSSGSGEASQQKSSASNAGVVGDEDIPF